VLLALLLLRAMWRYGLRAWLGSLGDSLSHGHDHAHGHAHGHDHHHEPAPAAQ
jgi:hypothetical protein